MRDQHAAGNSAWALVRAHWKGIARRTWRESADDTIGLIAAGVAFYGFLALVPLLGAVVLTYGIAADPATVVRHVQTLAVSLPPTAAKLIGDTMLGLVHASDGKKGLGLIVALGVALFGARNGAGAIITALNIAYEEKEKRSYLKINLLALAMTAAAVVALIGAALAIGALAALARLLPGAPPALLFLGKLLSYVVLGGAAAAGAAALYRFGPSRSDARFVWISPGSVLAALLWLALTLGFGTYVAHFGNYDATYGSLGAVVILLTWLYLSSYVLLFGGELNSEIEHQMAFAARDAAQATAPALPAPPVRAALPQPAATESTGSNFVAARFGARAGRIAGNPKIGWLSSGLASLGLTLLRRRGRRATGAALLATAAGISVLRSKA